MLVYVARWREARSRNLSTLIYLSVSVGLELVDPPGADGLVAEGVGLEVGAPEEALVLPEVQLARRGVVRRRVDLQP